MTIRVGHFPCFEFPLEKGKYCEISPREKGKNREIFVLNSQYIKIDIIMVFFLNFNLHPNIWEFNMNGFTKKFTFVLKNIFDP